MKNILLFSLLGLGEGALIAGVAVSLVLYYRGSGVINLAAGAVAMISGYAFWALRTGQFGHTFATGPALVIAFGVSVAQGLIMEFAAFRPLRNATPLAKLVASLGLLLFAQAGMLLAFGPNEQSEPAILPSNTVKIVGTPIPINQFILAGIVIACAAALAAIYRWTRFGLSTRAAAENEASAMLIGLSPNWLSLMNTLAGSVVAGMLGVLAAPLITLDSQNLPLIVVPALAAALLARFTSFGIACAVGLLIGALENLLYYASTQSWFPTTQGVALPGVQDLLIFLLIAISMFWRGTTLPRRQDIVERRLPAAPRATNLLRPALIAAVIGAAALTLFPYDFRAALMTSIIGMVLALSLIVITGFVGQISVVQLALSGGCGFIMSHFAISLGIGFPWAPITAIIITTVLGTLIALGALRVRGVQLAVVTLAAAVAMANFWFANAAIGGGISGAPVAQPVLFGLNLGNAAPFRGLDGQQPSPVLGYCLLAIAIGLGALVANVRRGELGRRMLAVRSNERAAAAVGVSVTNVKIVAFGIGSFIAGTAGAMFAYNFGSVSSDRFSALTALTLIAFTYVGGITMVSGAAIAGFLATAGLSQYAFQKWFGISGTWTVLFGGWAVLSNVIFWPDGIAGGVYKKRMARRQRAGPGPAVPGLAAADAVEEVRTT
jgi:branched-chain amino acid transport system permease protein